ncbi:hypothetical protein ACIQF8_16900 [Pseudarthrobacter sp. NPDC092184]|jgi:hypothetical protein|uniref:hypothetical protein n=1 Tax=unclassified Pseudarthrobacter TaxID=2647000 RepID=UPI0032EF6692
MTTGDGPVAGSFKELRPGDAVEAYRNGRMVHRGPVVEAIPQCGLFWILDTVTGSRRLIDVSEIDIVRLPPPAVEPRMERFLPRGRRQPAEGAPPAGNPGAPPSSWRDASPRR